MAKLHEETTPATWLTIPLDAETAARLAELSRVCGQDPKALGAALLHDLLEDDAQSHFLLLAPASSTIN